MTPAISGRGLGSALTALLAVLPVIPSFCEAACAAEAVLPGPAAGHCGEEVPAGGDGPQDPAGTCPGHDHPEVALAAGRSHASSGVHEVPAAVAVPTAPFHRPACGAAFPRSAGSVPEHSPPARPILRL